MTTNEGRSRTADGDMQEVIVRDLIARPWQLAPEDSIWLASGTYRNGGTFTDCLVRAIPHYITGGAVGFLHLPPLVQISDDVIGPDQIDRARRMVLVYADDPLTAFDDADQEYLR